MGSGRMPGMAGPPVAEDGPEDEEAEPAAAAGADAPLLGTYRGPFTAAENMGRPDEVCGANEG
jgi:hypothetical protein